MIRYKAHPIEEYNEAIYRIYKDTKKVHTITFQVTEDCCLKCTYCYQHNKSKNKLSFDTAKQLIDSLLNDEYPTINREKTKGIVLDFIGGEPLMEIDLIQQIVEYTFDQMIILNHPWLYFTKVNIGSNGILYNTPKVQDFFNKYGYLCHYSVSIDGSKELHDSCRIDLNNQGSYDRAISAVHQYEEQFGTKPPTKMTLSPDNISYLSKAIFNLIDEGYTDVHLNCVFEPGWTVDHARIMYNELKIVSNYLLNNNLYDKICLSIFDESSFTPMEEDENRNWCGGTTEGAMLAINHTGKLYPCIRYMESSLNGKQEEIYVGTVKNGYLSTDKEKENYKKINNITRRSQSTDECFNCSIARGCSWCSAYNYEETGSVNKRLTYICIMHKARALANVYYWNSLYRKLNLPLNKINYLSDEDSINIIGETELNNLKNLILESD